ncbi:MAG: hypothetical protein Q9213_007861 [Squamulea squamosa]
MENAMRSPRESANSLNEGGASCSNDKGGNANSILTNAPSTRDNFNHADPRIEPSGDTARLDPLVRPCASQDHFSASGLADRTLAALGPVIPAMNEHINGTNRQVRKYDADLCDTNNWLKDFSVDVDKITEYHGLKQPYHQTQSNGPATFRGFSTLSHSSSTDDSYLPDGVSAQVAYLETRIRSLEAHFQPNSLFLSHIDGLVSHINSVTTQINIIASNADSRFAILTNAYTKHFGQMLARQTELEQRFDRRIQHQTTRFLEQLDHRAADFKTRIDVTNEVLDQLTTTFNRLHVDDLSAQVQQNYDALQELSNRLVHTTESVHQELENIRANTHAAAVTMSAQSPPQPAVTTPVEVQRASPVTSSILDTPVPQALPTMKTQINRPAMTNQPTSHHPQTDPPSTLEPLDEETRALVMRNNIGLSKIMTSDDSYWAPRNVARRAADLVAAAASTAGPCLSDEQRTRMFKERLTKAGVRVSAREGLRVKGRAKEKEEEAYGCLDQFEQLLEEKSRVSCAGPEEVSMFVKIVVNDVE